MQIADGGVAAVSQQIESSLVARGVSAILPLEANRGCQQGFVKIHHGHEVVKLQFTTERLWDNGQVAGMLNTEQIFREALQAI